MTSEPEGVREGYLNRLLDLHGAKFNVTTGEATGPPATDPIKVFEVRLDGSDILIRKS